MTKKTLQLNLGLALIAALGLTGCVNRAAQTQAKKTQEILTDTTVPVQTVNSVTRDLEETLDVTGSFATSQESSIGASVAGRLVAVYVRDGDVVRSGQAIAQQETQDLIARLRQAQSQVDAARANLQQAQSDSQVGPTKSEAGVKAAEARLAQAKARYAKAKNGSRTEERTQAEWGVRRAKSDLDTAKAALDRAKRLFAEGAIAKVDVENAENRYQNALAAYEGALQTLSLVQAATRPEDLEAAAFDVRAAEEALRTARADKRLDVVFQQRVDAARASLNSAQEQVRLSQKALSDATIKSPFSGRISGKPAQAGTFVAPGTPVATVVGSGGTYFEANVPESKVALVLPGARVDVTVDALRGAKLTGTVLAINPLASSQGRVYTVRVGVAESIGIKPGMFAKGQVKLGDRPGAVVVPTEAIIRDGETAYLFVVQAEKAKRKVVETGLQNDGVIEVKGLSPGEAVVVAGQTAIVDGTKVKIEKPKKGA